jgi:tRNA1(Val) A37 N6-methylase TrmN6
MKEVLRSNDVVYMSWISALLADSGIEAVMLDTHMSVLEGSASAIPRRMMVIDEQYDQAMILVNAAERERGPGTTPDFLLNGRIVLSQPKTGFRAAIDPVMMAASVPEKPLGKVLDMGCGVGTAALCYAHRVPVNHVMALEQQPEMAALARDNVGANGLEDRITIVEGDLLDAPGVLEPDSFQHIMANPPYVAAAQGDPSMDPARVASHVEGDAGLADWISFAHARLVHKGSLTLIYDPARLDELMVTLQGCFGGVIVYPLWPSAGSEKGGKDAKRIIVQARKGVRTAARICAGLVLHEADGSYTAAAERILRDGKMLSV